MKDYIKLFKTVEDYYASKDLLPTPNVSLIDETGEVKLSSIEPATVEVEYVDLGLPSGTLWATCNLGANLPWENGLYFSWGNVIGHAGDEGYNFDLTTYNSTPGKSLTGDIPANSTYDAAVDIKGSPWQMPSKAQFIELFNDEYTNSIWTRINGVNGRLVISKINGNSVFFPASGYCYGTSQGYVGARGDYWSTSYYDGLHACGLHFDSGSVSPLSGVSRYRGFSVRPVQNPS